MKRPAPLPRPEQPEPSGQDRGARSAEEDAVVIGPPHLFSPSQEADPSFGTPPERKAPSSVSFPDVDRDQDVSDPQSSTDDGIPAERRVGWADVWRARRAHRKALRSEVRRFTVRQRRRRRIWIGSVSAVVILAGVSLAAAYSPLFAVQTITVTGVKKLDVAALAKDLEVLKGTPLPLVDAEQVRGVLADYPLVESYALEAHPPHDIVVRVVERTAVGAVKTGKGYQTVDAAGVVLATTKDVPKEHAVIDARGGVGSSAFVSAAHVMRVLPADVRKRVQRVTATTAHDVTLVLRDGGAEVVWGDADLSAKKAATLKALMTKDKPSDVRRYDVSSPHVATVVRR